MPVGAVMLGFQTKKKNGELHNRKSSILFFYYNYAFCEPFTTCHECLSFHNDLLAIDDVQTLLSLLKLLTADCVDDLLAVIGNLNILDGCCRTVEHGNLSGCNLVSAIINIQFAINNDFVANLNLILRSELSTIKPIAAENNHTLTSCISVIDCELCVTILKSNFLDIGDYTLYINLCGKSLSGSCQFVSLCYVVSCLESIADVNDFRFIAFLKVLNLGNLNDAIGRMTCTVKH